MTKLKFILIKAFKLYLVFQFFILITALLIWLSIFLKVFFLFAFTIPLLITFYITSIKIIDWDDLFNFDYYEF